MKCSDNVMVTCRSGDSTARIWTIPEGPCGVQMQAMPLQSHVLKHFKGRVNEKSKDVTTLDWNVIVALLPILFLLFLSLHLCMKGCKLSSE